MYSGLRIGHTAVVDPATLAEVAERLDAIASELDTAAATLAARAVGQVATAIATVIGGVADFPDAVESINQAVALYEETAELAGESEDQGFADDGLFFQRVENELRILGSGVSLRGFNGDRQVWEFERRKPEAPTINMTGITIPDVGPADSRTVNPPEVTFRAPVFDQSSVERDLVIEVFVRTSEDGRKVQADIGVVPRSAAEAGTFVALESLFGDSIDVAEAIHRIAQDKGLLT